MIETIGYATKGPKEKLEPFTFTRREPGSRDVQIEILYCGICHSDIHQVKDEWGGSIYPMVPGHEIVGRVVRVGPEVTKFKAGDLAGVGCMVDTCRVCENCRDGFEQYCQNHVALTYNSTEMDERTPTYGGYSDQIVVDEHFALKIAPDQPLAAVAPLLCAGITTYSPLKHFNVRAGQKVGVIGLGGLGHMGIKFAVSIGADVTVFSTSPSKEPDARALGAQHFVVTRDPKALDSLAGTFDFILDTVSASHDLNLYLQLLRRDGALVLVGLPEEPAQLQVFNLLRNRRTLAGSAIGGIQETQEMLDYCAANGITSDIEIIPIQQVEEAYERTVKGDVRYRFVIDMASLKQTER